jgi:hypothetical protein
MEFEEKLQELIELVVQNPLLLLPTAAIALLLLAYLRVSASNRRLTKRFNSLKIQTIEDAEDAVQKLQAESAVVQTHIDGLRKDYLEKRKLLDSLIAKIEELETDELAREAGLHAAYFDFQTSEEFKSKINSLRNTQKGMIARNTAMYCTTEWRVENSLKKGEVMTNRQIKLSLRAFNNEAEAAIANVKWNNLEQMQNRILKAFKSITNLNKSNQLYFNEDYVMSKLTELELTQKYREKVKEERDHATELRRLAREEKQLLADEASARKEEKKYQSLLDKASQKAKAAMGAELDKLQSEIKQLTGQLEDAVSRAERAKSMAEQTKAGFIYVISNVGSFGEGIVKIGMTRRLEPMDRVKELGDASVPFVFDLHALVYTENAPSLEKQLHSRFADQRVNMVNNRKEFFRVPLATVKEALEEIKPDVDFYFDVEAQEFKQTLELQKGESGDESTEARDEIEELKGQFPESI